MLQNILSTFDCKRNIRATIVLATVKVTVLFGLLAFASNHIVYAETIGSVQASTKTSSLGNKSEQPTTTDKQKKRSFKVGVSYLNKYPIYSSATSGDKGIGWAILNAFGEANNISFTFVAMPITKLQPSMDAGAIDFIFPDNPLWSLFRSNRLPNIYSATLMEASGSTFVAKENKSINLEDITKVAIPFGYTAHTWIGPIEQYGIKSVPVRDVKTGLNLLRTGSVDAIDIEYNTAMHLIRTNKLFTDRLVLAEQLPNARVEYKLSTIRHIMLLEKLSAFIEQEQELINALKTQYNIVDHASIFSEAETTLK